MSIAAERVSWGSGRRMIVDGVTLAARPGRMLGLLGPNGSGKSSLLRVLAGLQTAQQGRVELFGEVLNGPHPRVAVAFQDPSLLPWLSLEQNVGFGLDFARQPSRTGAQRQALIDQAIAAVDLQHARARYPSELSGGMAQRTALARCLAREPHVLLLDEPFGALDEVTRADMQQLLLNLIRERQTAAVLITHDIDEALLLSDRILLLGGTPAHTLDQWHIDLPQPRADLVDAAREAGDANFDVLIACAFNFDAPASEFSKLGRINVLKARMNADLHMAEDLKNTGKGNLFVIFGEPDVDVLDTQGRSIRRYDGKQIGRAHV